MVSEGPRRSNMMRSISIRLPLLISGLIVVMVGALSWLAYRGVRETLTSSAFDRLGFSEQIADLMEVPIRTLLDGGATLAANPQLRSYVFQPNEVDGRSISQGLQGILAAPEALSAEIRAADGTLLLNVGDEPPPSPLIGDGSAIEPGISPIYTVSDTVYYDTAIPIPASPEDSTRIGWMILRRSIRTGGALGELLAGMAGNETRLLISNRDGGVWTDMAGPLPEVPVTYVEGVGSYRYTMPDGDPQIARASPVPGTPWVIWMEQREHTVLAPARSFLESLWTYAILLVAVGATLAWALTRGITESVVGLSDAAKGIAAGDYGRRLITTRKDEIGHLSQAFNSMAEQIAGSHHELESRVAERTVKLRAAYRQLVEKQNELVRSERLAILGQLSSGVGHELRNPLGVMTNAVYYLEVVLSQAPDTVHEYLGILKGQIGLSEKIVGDLLDFARLKPPQVEIVSLESIVDHQIQRLGPHKDVAITKEFAPNLPPVAVDPIQIGQVVLNVLMNGVQAMSVRGGTLEIRAFRAGDVVALTVTDEGDGIPEINLQKIFEPLFTTKARGIGLGLAVSRSLTEGNRGTLSASSPPGEGATFTLTLPIAKAEGTT